LIKEKIMNAKFYLAALFTVITSGVIAEDNTAADACRKAVTEQVKGEIVKIELEKKNGKDIYEINVKSADGAKWEFKCDKASAKILEKDRELPNAEHPAFTAQKKIDEAQARKIALEAYPGTITKVEYEIEKDGTAIYEFDIDLNDGREMEVEVDAATGKIVKTKED
jgi:uncharacterized membrane protein YkoI